MKNNIERNNKLNEAKIKLMELFANMVEKYKDAEESVINERSSSISEDLDKLDSDCREYMEEFSNLLDSFD